MPPKNYELGSGTLYFEGSPIGEIKEVNSDFDFDDIDSVTTVKVIRDSGEATFTITGKVDRLILLSLVFGRRITNNWLKTHGGVMTRRWIK